MQLVNQTFDLLSLALPTALTFWTRSYGWIMMFVARLNTHCSVLTYANEPLETHHFWGASSQVFVAPACFAPLNTHHEKVVLFTIFAGSFLTCTQDRSARDLIHSVIGINSAFIIVILPCCVALTCSGPAEKTKLTFCNCVHMGMEVLNCVSVLVYRVRGPAGNGAVGTKSSVQSRLGKVLYRSLVPAICLVSDLTRNSSVFFFSSLLVSLSTGRPVCCPCRLMENRGCSLHARSAHLILHSFTNLYVNI